MAKTKLPAMKLVNWMPGKGDPRTYLAHRRRRLVLPDLKPHILDGDLNQRSRDMRRQPILRELALDLHVASLARLPFESVEFLLFGAEGSRRSRRRPGSRAPCADIIVCLDGDGSLSRGLKKLVVGKMERFRFRAPISFRIQLFYPFRKVVEVVVPPYSNGHRKICTVSWLCWATARAYDWAYRRWKQTGVWGHGMEDLALEGLVIRKGGIVEPLVGSYRDYL